MQYNLSAELLTQFYKHTYKKNDFVINYINIWTNTLI